jgi:hypothetical protein
MPATVYADGEMRALCIAPEPLLEEGSLTSENQALIDGADAASRGALRVPGISWQQEGFVRNILFTILLLVSAVFLLALAIVLRQRPCARRQKMADAPRHLSHKPSFSVQTETTPTHIAENAFTAAVASPLPTGNACAPRLRIQKEVDPLLCAAAALPSPSPLVYSPSPSSPSACGDLRPSLVPGSVAQGPDLLLPGGVLSPVSQQRAHPQTPRPLLRDADTSTPERRVWVLKPIEHAE